jgi:hypothetical protein
MATNVPGLTLTDKGWVAPSESAVLTGVQADINAAFGGGVNPALTTPQGQIATSLTAIYGNVNNAMGKLFNEVDPAFASGRMQDAIGRIYFITRKPAEPTVVQATCIGAQGVAIPVGSLAKAADGNIYTCTDGGVIDETGSITLTFANTVDGPIACPANSLNQIWRAIPGWDSINNSADGVLGNEVENRSEFEARRAASVAKNARGSLSSVLGAVLDVPNVLDAFVTENVINAPITVRGVSIAPKSLYVAAVGGTDLDVATAIWSKKAPGCAYNGNTTVTVTDSNSGYVAPLPTYQVTFERPNPLPILFSVFLASNIQIPNDATQQIQNAIIAAFAGADGGTRARIGSTIYASRFYAPIAALGSWAQIINIQIGSLNTAAGVVTGSIAGTTLTVTAVSSGALAIGQTITDTGLSPAVLPGTKIIAGAHPTWTVSVAQTISSRTLFGALPNQSLVEVNADQVPTISADNIVVTTT